jgi:hypothetical protein
MFTFRVHGKPSLQHPFSLLEYFFDGPERGKREYAQ